MIPTWPKLVTQIALVVQTEMTPLFLFKNVIEFGVFLYVGSKVIRIKVSRVRISKDAQLAGLKEQFDALNIRFNKKIDDLAATKYEKDELSALLPEHVLADIQNSWSQSKRLNAYSRVRAWFQRDHETLASLLDWRTKWCLGHAAGDIRLYALSLARACASASLVFNPQGTEAQSNLAQIDYLIGKTGERLPDFNGDEIWKDFDSTAVAYVYRERHVQKADILLSQAHRCTSDGGHLYALSLTEIAYELFLHNLGPAHPRTIAAKLSMAEMLVNVGKYPEAKAIASGLIAQYERDSKTLSDPSLYASALMIAMTPQRATDDTLGQFIFRIPSGLTEEQTRQWAKKAFGNVVSRTPEMEQRNDEIKTKIKDALKDERD